jgi:hypothetical protein
MPITLGYIGFSLNPGFPDTDIVTRFFKDGDRVSTNLSEINVLIIGDFLTEKELELIQSYKRLRILYVAEPILNLPMCSIAGQIFRENKYTAVIGCISNRGDTRNWVKYPIYRYAVKFTKDSFEEMNQYVASIDAAEINTKAFCTLINRHDWGNTRTPIYERLKNVSIIACPGKLFNNCSNEELNQMGNIEYIKKFIFNICSENFGNDHPGYVTEKLMNACLGGAIPIYYGELDEIDKKIFNVDRILFLNKDNTDEIGDRVKFLYENLDALEQFYRQPVFCAGAYEEMLAMDANAMGFFDTLREHLRGGFTPSAPPL